MKKRGIINVQLAGLIAGLGHKDTFMIAEGTDVCTVSRRLGHANTATTLNIYAHALQSKDTEAANTIERTLSRYAKIS